MLSLPKTFTPKCTKNHNHLRYGTWDMEWDRKNFFSFWAILCPFTPLLTPKIKIWKKCKRNLEILSYYTHVYRIWWLCDVWFLWYKTWWTKFFVILGHFLPSDPPNNPKNQNIEKKNEKSLEILSFYRCVPYMKIIWCMVPETWSATNRIFWHFGPFFPFYPLITHKIKILKKWKKCLEISSFYTSVP